MFRLKIAALAFVLGVRAARPRQGVLMRAVSGADEETEDVISGFANEEEDEPQESAAEVLSVSDAPETTNLATENDYEEEDEDADYDEKFEDYYEEDEDDSDLLAQEDATRTKAMQAMPCQCGAANPMWTQCNRSVPKCVFIDLGAADGNTFNDFLLNQYVQIEDCPSNGTWHAILVEANPRFEQPLENATVRFPGAVETHTATAAYMCEGQTTFYLDTVSTDHNFWGSSMSTNHPDVRASGKQHVTVGTVNLNRVLHEQTIPEDYVVVKMDIEGSEYDIIPCLADSKSSKLVDALFMEEHDPSLGLAGNSLEVFEDAKALLETQGVSIPVYSSPTL